MNELYVPLHERDALKSIAPDVLYALIDRALREQHTSALRLLPLERCGPHTASHFHRFDKALPAYGSAKAAKKIAETEARARRAGSDLAHAVRMMQERVEREEKEAELFYVDDRAFAPYRLSERLRVPVSYRWRATAADPWRSGTVVFTHDVVFRPDYSIPRPSRKPSVLKQARERDDTLRRIWDELSRSALYAVRDFFRQGGDGSAIPDVFPVVADPYTGGLNNFSTQFWRDA